MPQFDNLCPWCQTEIVWDPEIGPEDTCPHCLNELGDYRSVTLNINQNDRGLLLDDEDDEDDDSDELELLNNGELYDDIDGDMMDPYEEGVQQVLDTQEEVPECTNCHSFMLFAGSRTMALGFVPFVPSILKQPLLKANHASKVYVCPSCFKIEHILADEDRAAMIELLKKHGSK